MAKFIVNYIDFLPSEEYVVVYADNPEDAMMMARQELGQLRDQHRRDLEDGFKVIRLEAP